jgi:predicted RNA-binding protein YlqC (UPF0109 family)
MDDTTEQTQEQAAWRGVSSLFTALAKALVSNPDKLEVEVRHGAASVTVASNPTAEDTGNLIGRKGRTVKAFQLLARLAGAKAGWAVNYCVQADGGPNPAQQDRPEPEVAAKDGRWARALLERVLRAVLLYPASVSAAEFCKRSEFEVVPDDREPEQVAALTYVVPPDSGGGEPTTVRGDAALGAALSTVFAAAGKAKGRKVAVHYVRRRAAAPQPARADGRFAEVVR